MPLTDAQDAEWAIDQLQDYIRAVGELLQHRRNARLVDREKKNPAAAQARHSTDRPEDIDLNRLIDVEERSPGESQRRVAHARKDVLQRNLVIAEIWRQIIDGVPNSLRSGPDVDNERDLKQARDLADMATDMIKNLRDFDERLGEPGPRLSATSLHRVVWDASERLWGDGHHGAAVQAAAAFVNTYVQSLVGRRDVSDAALMREVFSTGDPSPTRPRLRWPGDPADLTVKSMNEGLRNYAPGVFLAIRNPVAHGAALSQQEAMEQLASLSVLMRWIDQCALVVSQPPTFRPIAHSAQ